MDAPNKCTHHYHTHTPNIPPCTQTILDKMGSLRGEGDGHFRGGGGGGGFTQREEGSFRGGRGWALDGDGITQGGGGH